MPGSLIARFSFSVALLVPLLESLAGAVFAAERLYTLRESLSCERDNGAPVIPCRQCEVWRRLHEEGIGPSRKNVRPSTAACHCSYMTFLTAFKVALDFSLLFTVSEICRDVVNFARNRRHHLCHCVADHCSCFC